MFDWTEQLYGGITTVYVVLLCLVFAASFSYVFDAKVDLNGDNAKYYLLGQSIAEGKGYVSLYEPGEPPTSVYPPGYPLLASGVLLFTESIVAQKVLNGLFLLGSALLLFLIVRRLTENDLLSFAIAVLTVVNFHLLKFSTIMMSEASFTFFSLVAVVFLMRSRGRRPAWRSGAFWAFVAALSFAFHIRTQGISLVAGALFYFLCARQWRRLGLTGAGFVGLALPWRLRNRLQDLGSSRYLDQLFEANPWRPEAGDVSIVGLLGRTLDQGAMLITKGIPDSLFNVFVPDYQAPSGAGEWVLGVVVLGVLLYGFWRLTPYRFFFLGYFLAVFGIVASWSATVDNRYLVTIIPVLNAGFFYGAYLLGRALLERIGPSVRPATVVPIAVLVFGGAMVPQLTTLRAQSERSYPRGFYNYFQSANELGRRQECTGTLVSCRKPALFHLFSGCYVTRYAFSKDPKTVIRKMLTEEVDFVVLDQIGYSSTARYLYPAIKKHSALFQVVIQKEKPATYVLRFDRQKARALLGDG
jgi:hypothetical protein